MASVAWPRSNRFCTAPLTSGTMPVFFWVSRSLRVWYLEAPIIAGASEAVK
ncbi:hypothetical protein D3C81_2048770 [compost metagenome]